MKVSVQVNRGIENLFGTRDENIRVLETGLNVSTRLVDSSLEVEGEPGSVARAEEILEDYFGLVCEGVVFNNGDLQGLLRVVTEDPEVSLRGLVQSGRLKSRGSALGRWNVSGRRLIAIAPLTAAAQIA